MAGWDVLMQPYIYHPPQPPEMPKPQITTGEAVQNLLRGAIARRDQQLEQQRMVQNADLTMRGQDITARDANLRYKVAKENADSMEQSRADTSTWHDQTRSDRSDLEKAKLQASLHKADAETKWQTDVSNFDARAVKDVQPLLDPTMLHDDPGSFYVNAQDWKSKYGLAKVGAAPDINKQLDQQVASLTIPYVPGAQLVNSKGDHTGNATDPVTLRVPAKDGVTWLKATPANILPRQIASVYQDYQDPANRQNIEMALVAAGHGTLKRQTDPNNKNNTYLVPTLDSWGDKLLNAFGKRRVSQSNQVPSAMMSAHPKWAIKAGAGTSPDLPEEADPLQPEADYVRSMIDSDPDNAEANRAKFLARHPGREDLLTKNE